jgi:hypothetical protein
MSQSRIIYLVRREYILDFGTKGLRGLLNLPINQRALLLLFFASVLILVLELLLNEFFYKCSEITLTAIGIYLVCIMTLYDGLAQAKNK